MIFLLIARLLVIPCELPTVYVLCLIRVLVILDSNIS